MLQFWRLVGSFHVCYGSFGNPRVVRALHTRDTDSSFAGRRRTTNTDGDRRASSMRHQHAREQEGEERSAPSHIRTSTGAPSRGEILDAARAHGARGRFGEGDFLAFLGFWAVASVAVARAWWAVASRVPHRIVESCSRGALRFSAIPYDSAWDETSTLLRPRSDLLR